MKAKLEYTPDLIVLKNQHAGLVDHLSYVDHSLTYEDMCGVKAIIKDFQKSFPKKDYLSQTLALPTDSMLSQSEIERIKSGKKTELVF